MTYRTRKILFTIFTILFLLITPLTILYAAGYKINFKDFSIQKTGALIIETDPKDAKIFLNNEASRTLTKQFGFLRSKQLTTPAKIKNMLPGEYDLSLRLDGYWEWRNKITIKPNETTILNDILLIRKEVPLLISENSNQNIFDSPDNSQFAFFDNAGAINVYDMGAGSVMDLEIGTSTDHQISWSPDGTKLLAGNKLYYDLDKRLKKSLSGTIPDRYRSIGWNGSDGGSLYYTTDKDLFILDLGSMKSSLVLRSKNILDFMFHQKELVSIEDKDNKSAVYAYSQDGGKLISRIEVPFSKNYKFIHPNSSLINLYDGDRHILYLIDTGSYSPLKDTINNIHYSNWIDRNTLLYNNDNEIWTYDSGSGKKNLQTRVSERLISSFWHPSGKYIIYNTSDTIYSFEPGNEMKYNIAELTKFQEIDNLILDKKGDSLYFYGKIGNQKGLYKMQLK